MPQLISQLGELDLFAIHHGATTRFPFLLESRVVNDKIGRYSLLLGDIAESLCVSDPLKIDKALQHIQSTAGKSAIASDLPFSGGWLIYLAYEAAQQWYRGLRTAPLDHSDLLRADYCQSAVIVDHVQHKTHFLSLDANAAQLQSLCASLCEQWPTEEATLPKLQFSEEPADRFTSSVDKAVDYILAGDVYQTNISRRWHGPECSMEDCLGIYAALRQDNPASFSASCHWDDYALASASPERLFRVERGYIDTRPIAGTRPRMANPSEDAAKIQELRSNLKEQAEHIMLVDLERNDLGRVGQSGSVVVDELLAIESYASVHHLVSNIRAKLRPEVTLRDILEAVFPGGTITGCPKLRCMQIIAELEQRPRGAYTGSIGYVSDCGYMDFNILIRTVVHRNGHLELDAGAGIVADSKAAHELKETRAKAKGVLSALGVSI